MADEVKSKTQILVVGERIHREIEASLTGRTHREPHIVPLLYPREPVGGSPLLADYGPIELHVMAELGISALEIREAKTALKEDWLRHWPGARDFLPVVPGVEKTPHSDVAVLASLSVEVRRIRRRRSR